MKKIILLLSIVFITVMAFGQATGYVLPNFASSGSIGTAATTVDVYSRININQITPSITLSIPNPTNTSTKVTEVWVGNIGTVSFSLAHCGVIDTATCVILKWTGSNYSVIGRKAVTYGSGTVTSVSIVSANGVSGAVSNPTTTPSVTLSLGAITPTSVVASGAISGSNISGTNTGDQTNITGNAGTVTTNANLTGDVTSVGNATTLSNTAVAAGSYTNTNITVDSKGRLTSATSGTGGGGAPTGAAGGDLSGTYPNPTVAGQVVKSVVLNTSNVIFTNPVTFTTGTNTATGTLALNTQSANTSLMGPVSGGVATPTFRSLTSADLPASVVLKYIGNIVSIPTWTSQSANFTQLGTAATFTYGTTLAISNATPFTTTVTDYITYNPRITNYEDWTITVPVTVGTVDANSKGIYLGLNSTVTGFLYDFGAAFLFDATNGGYIEMYYNKSTTGKITSTNRIPVVTGATYTLTFSRKINQFIATITDASGNSNTFPYELALSYPAASIRINPNAGKFAIGSLGGSFTVGAFNVNSNMPVGYDRCIIGNSIMDGVFIEDPAQRMAAQLQGMTDEKIVVYAQPGNLVQSVVASELIALQCSYYHISLGTNNFTLGESPATIQGRITTLVNALVAGGIPSTNIFVHSLLPRGSSVVAVNSQLASTFGAQYKDFYTTFTGVGTALNALYTDDALHLNYLGQNRYAKTFYSLFNLKTKSNAQFESYAMHNPLSMAIGLKGYTPFSSLDIINSAWQLRVGSTTNDEGGYIGSVTPSNLSFGGGVKYSGSQFIAKATSATLFNMLNNGVGAYADNSLTTGSAYTPTLRWEYNPTDFKVYNTASFIQNSAGSQFNITNTNTTSSAYLYSQFTCGSVTGGITQFGNGYNVAYQSGKTWLFNGSAGSGLLLQGSILHLNAGNTLSDNLYRLQNGTSSVSPNIMLGAAGGAFTAGLKDWLLDQTNGLVFTQYNGIYRIAGGGLKLINTTTTVNTEAADLGVYTQIAGQQMALRATFSGTGAYFTTVAGTATAAPIKLMAGVNLTTPVSGAIEFDGTNFYGTNSSAVRVKLTNEVIGGQYTGTGTATTTYTVTIPTQANTTYKVNVEPTNALTAVMQYATNKTTTSFDVTFVTALTGAVAFDWTLVP